jgi:putative (di)nucleoside polyphosphate hydrolase
MADEFRQNVAAIIINKDKKILMCEHAWIDNAWQFPQGGVDNGESEEEAILRELNEEIGTTSLKIISKMDETLFYKFPYYLKDKYNSDGQEQRFFFIYFNGSDDEIRFDNQAKPEFKAYEWVDYEEPPKRVIYFKKLSYLRALEYFKKDFENFSLK